MDRVVLYTDLDGFQKDVAKYGEKVQKQQDIKSEMKKLLPKYKVTNDFFKDIDLSFYNAIEKAYPEHIKLMKAQKVPEMIDMDISKLMKLSSEYEAVRNHDNVSISSYEIVAETQDEIDKYNAVKKLLESIKEAESICGFEVMRGDIMRGTKNWVYADMYKQGMRVNHSILLEKRRADSRARKQNID